MEYTHIVHGFEPVFDSRSRILILGSLPSAASREQSFYYGHPRNRFWRVIAAVTENEVPDTVPQKKELLLRSGIAVWDVIAECDIAGSSDASIRNVVPSDLSVILGNSRIASIITNGSAASRIYRRYQLPVTRTEAIQLPSTSPANAAWSLDRLTEEWRKAILPFLQDQ